jgi:anti-sigma B factor antagonist
LANTTADPEQKGLDQPPKVSYLLRRASAAAVSATRSVRQFQRGGIDMSLAEEFEVREHSEFTIRTNSGPDLHVIEPHGELDLATKDELHEALVAALEGSAQTIVLDLSGLEFIDSAGIQLINLGIRLAGERQREFYLRRGPQHIQRIFEVSGITDRLPFID